MGSDDFKIICSVSLCAPLQIDLNSFELWLKGLTANEITENLLNRSDYTKNYQTYLSQVYSSHKQIMQETNLMVRQSVTNQIRNFPLLCQFLASPHELLSQTAFHIPKEQCKQLLEIYFQIEPIIVREILGSKYKTKLKGLESLSEKIKFPHIMIKRMFDNIRSIYQIATKSKENIPISLLIQKEFMISKDLTEKYILIIFLCYHRFETSKKRLNSLKSQDFMRMTNSILTNWGTSSLLSNITSFNFNNNFIESLKVLKPYFTKEIVDDYKQIIISEYSNSISNEKLGKIEKELSNILKIFINLSISISQTKELKDLFITIVEKIQLTVTERMDLNTKETRGLFRVIIASFDGLKIPIDIKDKVSDSWAKFLLVLGKCTSIISLAMY